MLDRLLVGVLVLSLTPSTIITAQPFGEEQVLPFGLEEAGTGSLEYANGFDLGDIDADGDQDLFLFYQDGQQIFYFENTLTNNGVSFASAMVNPFSIVVPEPGFLTFHSFVLEDIDNDSDLDILLGDLLRPFVLIENIGTSKTPNFANPVSNDFFLEDCSLRPHAFGDIDSDGDLDVLTTVYLGGDQSKICLVQNEGSASNPDFLLPGDMSTLGEGDLLLGNGDFFDFDQDGDSDYLHAEVDGNLSFHENTSTGQEISFGDAISNPWGFDKSGENNSTPRMVDIDLDGDLDYFELDLFNGTLFYRPNLSKVSSTDDPQANLAVLSLFPNPAFDQLSLRVELFESSSYVQIYIQDIGGRIHQWHSFDNPGPLLEFEFDLSTLPAGNFILELQTETRKYSRTFIKSE